MEDTDVIILWGSNARETHPIFFHHVLAGVRNGARLYCVDPRRTSSARWADVWLGLNVGHRHRAVEHHGPRDHPRRPGTTRRSSVGPRPGFEEYAASVEEWTLERGEAVTGVPGGGHPRAGPRLGARPTGLSCAGRSASPSTTTRSTTCSRSSTWRCSAATSAATAAGSTRCGGRTTSRAAATWAPSRTSSPASRTSSTTRSGRRSTPPGARTSRPATAGTCRGMFEAMEHGDLTALYVIGENPAQSEAESEHAVAAARAASTTSSCRTSSSPGPRSWPTWSSRPAAAWCESEGTVTNSERRVQRVRKALEPPEGARDDIEIIARHRPPARPRLDATRRPRRCGTSCARLSPMHAGMSYRRLEELGGIQWPCYREDRARAVVPPRPAVGRGPGRAGPRRRRSRSSSTSRRSTQVDDEFPFRLTTGRRLDSYNTGVQSGGFASPLRFGETIDLSPDDAGRLGHRADGEQVRVSSRRGTLVAPARIDVGLRPGLVFMTMHFPDEIDTNVLTIEAIDPKSGTAEFKASAVRIEKLQPLGAAGGLTPDGPALPRRPSERRGARRRRRRARAALVGRGDGRGRRRTPTWPSAGRATARRAGSQLLPALHAVNDRVGWVSHGALNYVARAARGPAGRGLRRAHVLRLAVADTPDRRRVVHVCTDLACLTPGRGRAAGGARRRREPQTRTAAATWHASPCLGDVRAGAGGDGGRGGPRRPPRRCVAPAGPAALLAAMDAAGRGRLRPRRATRGVGAPGRRPVARAAAPRRRRRSGSRSPTTARHGGYPALRRAARARARSASSGR